MDLDQLHQEMHAGFERLEDRLERMEDQQLDRVDSLRGEQREQWASLGKTRRRVQWLYGVVAVGFILLSGAVGFVLKQVSF